MKHIYICTSKIEGQGVTAGELINKGDVIQHIKGEAKFLTIKSKGDSLSYPNWIGIAKDAWIDPDHPNQYLNHSCNPNASVIGRITIDKQGAAKGKYQIIALKRINEGQEITIDYSVIEGDDLWEMPCNCGQHNCRKIVRSVNFLPKKQFQKYFPFVPVYFKNLYFKSHPELSKQTAKNR